MEQVYGWIKISDFQALYDLLVLAHAMRELGLGHAFCLAKFSNPLTKLFKYRILFHRRHKRIRKKADKIHSIDCISNFFFPPLAQFHQNLYIMKRLLLLLLLLPTISFAQVLGLGKRLSEYKASNGITYHVGDTVKLGQGSAPNGTFRYVQYGGWLMFTQGGGTDAHNVERSYSGYGAVIKKIHSFKAHGIPKVVFAVDITQSSNFDLWIEDAITTCEVANCTGHAVHATVVQQSDDNLDRLKKLKGLLDSGAISQAEYNEQKKKLLNQ